jgi:nucleotide-binding universal stress UspA family protein
MLRSILIGVNGTAGSDQARELGLDWAKSHRVPATCLGIVDVDSLSAMPIAVGGMAINLAADAEALACERARIAAALQAACERAQALGVECHPLNRDGSPAEVLGMEAQRHDLVVLGRRLVSKSDRDPATSTTLMEILRHASRPVVVAGDGLPTASHVVVAYDGSAQAARTLQAYVQSGLHFGHPLHLVGIGEDPIEVQFRVTRALDYVQTHGRSAELHVLPIRNTVAATLAQFVRQLPCGLLVMGVYGQSRLRELLFGSVTATLLREVPAPLFLHH